MAVLTLCGHVQRVRRVRTFQCDDREQRRSSFRRKSRPRSSGEKYDRFGCRLPCVVEMGGALTFIGEAERKVVTAAVATTFDALKRAAIGSGKGVGRRSGTFQTSFDGGGNQTTTLTKCSFASDVTVNVALVGAQTCRLSPT